MRVQKKVTVTATDGLGVSETIDIGDAVGPVSVLWVPVDASGADALQIQSNPCNSGPTGAPICMLDGNPATYVADLNVNRLIACASAMNCLAVILADAAGTSSGAAYISYEV